MTWRTSILIMGAILLVMIAISILFTPPANAQEVVARADFVLVIEDERTVSLRCFATVPSINWRQSWCFTRGPSPEVHGFIDLEAPAGITPLEMTVVCFAFSALGCNGRMSGPSEQLVAVATEP